MKQIIALSIVYLVWGSTYLGIRVGLESLPPFLLIGSRFFIAGLLVWGWARLRGERSGADLWKQAALLGGLLLVMGPGAVAWAQQWVPSGLAAVLVATSPLWIALLDRGSKGISPFVALGLVTGLAGITMLVGASLSLSQVPFKGIAVLLLSALSWALGSLLSRRMTEEGSAELRSGAQMLVAGAVLVLLALASGERVDVTQVSLRSWLALAYLTVMGSVVGFSAYTWLLANASPVTVSTHAYVNPVVAMVLGVTLAGETLTLSMASAGLVALAGVVLVMMGDRVRLPQPRSRMTPSRTWARPPGPWAK